MVIEGGWSYHEWTQEMGKRFEYRGDLTVTPLAEVLATINRYRVPGVLTLALESRIRKIQLDDGVIAFASSNEREMSLGMHLLKDGILKPDAAREAEARRTRDGLRLGQVLLQMGVLTPESLNQAVLVQVREILWSSFDWDLGDVTFDIGPREGRELVRIDLAIPEAILEGIRRMSDVRRIAARLGSSQTLFERTQSPSIGLFTEPEQKYYREIDGRTPLQKLCARGPGNVSENARILYALFCLGLLRRARATSPGAKKIQYKTEGGTLGS
ncbi:MAG TPA: DUF4388 domain-containing protein [Thermoanaerobaculia bacterium]